MVPRRRLRWNHPGVFSNTGSGLLRPSLRCAEGASAYARVQRAGDAASFDRSIHLQPPFWLRISEAPYAKLRLADSPDCVWRILSTLSRESTDKIRKWM